MSNTETRPVGSILRIDASMRKTGSVSRELTDRLIAGLANAETSIVTRDLADSAPGYIDETWIGSNFTPADDRSPEQKARLAESDALVAEIQAADTIVIGAPIYNFSVPAALKGWIDHVARAGLTFKYTENGPVGLLEGKKAYVLMASGGTEVASEIDFASGYLRHVLGFIGIQDVEIVAADRLMMDPARKDSAEKKLDAMKDAA